MLPGSFENGRWLARARELKTRLNKLKHADVGGAK
jgi:hypothetical protein